MNFYTLKEIQTSEHFIDQWTSEDRAQLGDFDPANALHIMRLYVKRPPLSPKGTPEPECTLCGVRIRTMSAGRVAWQLLENGKRTNVIFVCADIDGDCWRWVGEHPAQWHSLLLLDMIVGRRFRQWAESDALTWAEDQLCGVLIYLDHADRRMFIDKAYPEKWGLTPETDYQDILMERRLLQEANRQPAPTKPSRTPLPPGRRFSILKRDGYRCQLCGVSASDDASIVLHVDHKTPVAKGGTHEVENLWTLCQPCNAGKSDEDL